MLSPGGYEYKRVVDANRQCEKGRQRHEVIVLDAYPKDKAERAAIKLWVLSRYKVNNTHLANDITTEMRPQAACAQHESL